MATKTAGSLLTTSLTALQWPSFSATSLSDADIATIQSLIVNDVDPTQVVPGAFSRLGLLYVPNRGVLKVMPGDWVAVDANGWPILIADNSLPTTLALFGTPVSGSTSLTLASSAYTAGWQIGGQITGTGIAASTLITNIDPTGLILTLSKAATSSPGATTLTAGTYTHS